MEFGSGFALAALKAYAHSADALGYRYLCANDHLLFSRPWLDGPTALAAVLEESGQMTLGHNRQPGCGARSDGVGQDAHRARRALRRTSAGRRRSWVLAS